MRTIIASLAVFTLASGAWGQFVPEAAAPIQMTAVASHLEVARGQTFYVAVNVTIKSGYIFYSPDPGGTKDFSPLPARIQVLVKGAGEPHSTAPSSKPDTGVILAGDILWPPAKQHEYELAGLTLSNRAYEGRITIYVPLTPSKNAAGDYPIQVVLEGQVCSSVECVPVNEVQSAAVVFVGDKSVANAEWVKMHLAEGLAAAKAASQTATEVSAIHVEGAEYGLAAGFALALLAGLILNIMPCVLPVIPLKVLGMVQQAAEIEWRRAKSEERNGKEKSSEEEPLSVSSRPSPLAPRPSSFAPRSARRRFVTLGLAFAGGVVMFFVGIAGLNVFLKLVLQSAFQWGEHFQSTPLRIAMAALMVVLAANLFGLFTVLAPKRAGAAEAAISQRKGHLRALGMGLLTGVLATPCSFAILGAALAFAQSQTLLVGSLAIVVIGIGMALPYAILTAFPGLVKHLPRPGRWMEIFKQTMGFAMVLVALWLLSTVAQDAYPFWVAGFIVLLILAIWMWMNFGFRISDLGLKKRALSSPFPAIRNPQSEIRNRWGVRALAVLLAVSAAAIMLPPPRPLAVKFEPFDQVRIDQASGSGRIVLVDFTAAWCLTCKQVEYTVYNNPDVAATIRQFNVLAVKGDITTADMPANELKKKFGQGIPVTVIFPSGGANAKKPIVLSGLFSSDRLVRELKEAAREGAAGK
jgi:thiol:disulfide interchange protein DsbD